MNVRLTASIAVMTVAMSRAALETALAQTVNSAPVALTKSDSATVAQIDRFADSVIRAIPVAGMSIVMRQGSKTLVSRGYGVAGKGRVAAPPVFMPLRSLRMIPAPN